MRHRLIIWSVPVLAGIFLFFSQFSAQPAHAQEVVCPDITWTADFFYGTDITGTPVATAVYPNLNFTWTGVPLNANNVPIPNFSVDNFSVVFTATAAYEAGTYRFEINADDGARLFINGTEIINVTPPGGTQTADVQLPGGDVLLRIEFVELTGNARLFFGDSCGGLVTDLQVGGNINQGVVRPTFTFNLPKDKNGNPIASEWFQIMIMGQDRTIWADQWFKLRPFCNRLRRCNFTPTRDVLLAGLPNGQYQWRVRLWSSAHGLSSWSQGKTFTINVPAPDLPQNVQVNQGIGSPAALTSTLTNTSSIPDGELVFTWADDLETGWWHITINKQDTSETVYDAWYERTDIVCDGVTCTFIIPQDPDNGALDNGKYTVVIQAYGAGGFNDGAPLEGSSPVNFTLQIGEPGIISGLTDTFYLANANSGEPTFGWIPATDATWTLIYLGQPNGDGTYKTNYIGWHQVADMNCPGGLSATCTISPNNVFLPNGTFEWWMIGWGPGGFSTGGAYNGWVKSPLNVVVNAPAPAKALPITPTNSNLGSDEITYRWTQVPSVTWYQIWLGDAPTEVNGVETWIDIDTYYLAWVHARDICVAGVCSITPDEVYLPDGNYRWYIETYNPAWTGTNWNIQQFGSFRLQRPPG